MPSLSDANPLKSEKQHTALPNQAKLNIIVKKHANSSRQDDDRKSMLHV